MGEADTIHPDQLPLTVESLADQFAACGLAEGQTVLVHTRMSRLGWIAGGAVSVIQALLRVLGASGTLMMPTHSADNTNPANWSRPPVPERWWQIIRDHAPPYDPAVTPTRGMGKVAELFRTYPGVIRSAHPIGSFAALGANAEYLTRDHPIPEPMFGDGSPVARLYDLDGYVFLLGVDHVNNTSLHLAEYRADFPKKYVREGTALLVDGQRQWLEYDLLDYSDADFGAIGDRYEAEHAISRCRVGMAEARFMKQRPLVDYAVAWMERNRR